MCLSTTFASITNKLSVVLNSTVSVAQTTHCLSHFNACACVHVCGSKRLGCSDIKRLAGVTLEVNLRNLLHAGDEA